MTGALPGAAALGQVKLGAVPLRLTIAAMIRVEEEAGVRIPAMIGQADISGGFAIRELAIILHAAMIEAQPDASFDDAVALMEATPFAELSTAVRALIQLAFPAPPSAEGKAKRQPMPPKSTG